MGPRWDGSCSAAQLRRPSNPSFPTIEFTKGPRPPQPRAATSKRLYRTRAELPASVHSSPRTRIRESTSVNRDLGATGRMGLAGEGHAKKGAKQYPRVLPCITQIEKS